MQFSAQLFSDEIPKGTLLVFGFPEGETDTATGLSDTLDALIAKAFGNEDFEGKPGQTLLLYHDTGRVLLLGLGAKEKLTMEKVRRYYGSAGKTARKDTLTKAAVCVPVLGSDGSEKKLYLQAALEGFALATYRFAKYRSRKQDKHPTFESVRLLVKQESDLEMAKLAAERADVAVDGVFFARDLVTAPAGEIYPESLANKALALASENILVEVLDRAKLEELGMGALLAVGQGSNKPPVMIHLDYNPYIDGAKSFTLIGKGITFDAGGLDLKPPAGMRDMKIDMSGSASVLGVFKALERWQPGCRVHGFIPAAENLVGGWAYKPGDILTSYKGLTIEIDNTDAEGRLAMCDALAYAVETIKPDAILDIATLTGACMIALGHHGAGLFTNDDALYDVFNAASDPTGERVWRLPLWEEFDDQIKSEVADIKNTGGRPGGASTAAVFLQEFVGDTPWVHLDIAGTASGQSYSYTPHKQLGTGVGVRLILEALTRWAKA